MKDFEILSKLGEGAFGVVFKVKRREDGEEYALKKVKIGSMKEKERENAVNEIRILASLDDEHIIGYKDCFYDETTSTLCVVMEFASGGDLLKKVSNHVKARTKFPEE